MKVTLFFSQKLKNDSTTHNKKLDVIILDHENGTRVLKDIEISWDRTVIKKEVRWKSFKIPRPYNRNTTRVERKTKVMPVITKETGKI
jgi:hypothetical protein